MKKKNENIISDFIFIKIKSVKKRNIIVKVGLDKHPIITYIVLKAPGYEP